MTLLAPSIFLFPLLSLYSYHLPEAPFSSVFPHLTLHFSLSFTEHYHPSLDQNAGSYSVVRSNASSPYSLTLSQLPYDPLGNFRWNLMNPHVLLNLSLNRLQTSLLPSGLIDIGPSGMLVRATLRSVVARSVGTRIHRKDTTICLHMSPFCSFCAQLPYRNLTEVRVYHVPDCGALASYVGTYVQLLSLVSSKVFL